MGADATMRGSNGECVSGKRTRSIVHDDQPNERRDSAIVPSRVMVQVLDEGAAHLQH